MCLPGKPKLLQKKIVVAACSRELERSRLQAATTKTNTLVLPRYPRFHIPTTDNGPRTTDDKQLTTYTSHYGFSK